MEWGWKILGIDFDYLAPFKLSQAKSYVKLARSNIYIYIYIITSFDPIRNWLPSLQWPIFQEEAKRISRTSEQRKKARILSIEKPFSFPSSLLPRLANPWGAFREKYAGALNNDGIKGTRAWKETVMGNDDGSTINLAAKCASPATCIASCIRKRVHTRVYVMGTASTTA